MQELLGRISALDPQASLGLRVIACFDELIIGNVNTWLHKGKQYIGVLSGVGGWAGVGIGVG